MPELPEVESIVRDLNRELSSGHRIAAVKLYRRDLRVPIPDDFEKSILKESIVKVRRRAKYLLIDTDHHTVLSHLGMSGSWRLEEGPGRKRFKHDHCELQFQNGRRLIYHDPRRFGVLAVYPLKGEESSRWLRHLGPEPFDPKLSAEQLKERARRKKINVKNFIMDQTIVVGVGNIYASEALFQAGVRPSRQASRLKLIEWQKLLEAIRKSLLASIDRGGTTLRDYRKASGDKGENQNHLLVYGRTGLNCKSCKDKIRHSVIAARSTYWCPSCQK